MQSLAVNGFTHEQVEAAIRSTGLGTGERRFRFELYDVENNFIRHLTNVIGGDIHHIAKASVKNAATLKIREATITLDGYPTLVIDDGTLFYLRMGEESGTTLQDSSGAGRDFTTHGTVGFSRESLLLNHPENTAILFNGSDTYADIADAPWMDVSALTCEAWIQTSTAGAIQVIMSRDNASTQRVFQFRITDTTGSLQLILNSPTETAFTAPVNVTDGVRHHVVGTYNGSHVEIYVDSVLVLRLAHTGTLNSATLGISIGRLSDDGGFFNGVIDEATFSGRAISGQEVREHYQQGSGQLSEIDYERDRIKILCAVKMEANGDDGTPWAEAPVAYLLLSAPDRDMTRTGIVRSVTCDDQTIILLEDCIATDRHIVTQGTNYITAITSVLQSAGLDTAGYQLQPTSLTLPTSRAWAVGTNKLQVVNDLLKAINYKPFRFAPSGLGVAEENVLPEERAVEFDYTTDTDSIVAPEMRLSLDLAAVANHVLLKRDHPKLGNLVGEATNNNFNSPVSVIKRGNRKKTLSGGAISVEAPDQTTINAMAVQMLSDVSQPSQTWRFKTALNPFHDDQDKLTVADTTGKYKFDLEGEWIEDEWILPLDDTALMEHIVRRVISVS